MEVRRACILWPLAFGVVGYHLILKPGWQSPWTSEHRLISRLGAFQACTPNVKCLLTLGTFESLPETEYTLTSSNPRSGMDLSSASRDGIDLNFKSPSEEVPFSSKPCSQSLVHLGVKLVTGTDWATHALNR